MRLRNLGRVHLSFLPTRLAFCMRNCIIAVCNLSDVCSLHAQIHTKSYLRLDYLTYSHMSFRILMVLTAPFTYVYDWWMNGNSGAKLICILRKQFFFLPSIFCLCVCSFICMCGKCRAPWWGNTIPARKYTLLGYVKPLCIA